MSSYCFFHFNEFQKKKLENELDNKTNENDENIGKIKKSQRHCYTFSSSLASMWSGRQRSQQLLQLL